MQRIQTLIHKISPPINRRTMIAAMAITALTIVGLIGVAFSTASAEQDIDKLNRFLQTQKSSEASAKAFREGRDLIGDENWKGAADKFNGFIESFPKDPNVDAALYWLAFAQAKQEKYADADSRIRLLLKKFPRSNWADDARALQVQIAPNLGKTVEVANDDDEEIKILALESLFRSNPERGMAYVRKLLTPGSTDSRRMKEAGIELIRRFGGEQTVPLLIEVIRSQSDPELRKAAIHTLGRTEDERAFDVLLELVNTSTDDEIAKAAVFAISRFDGDKARNTLVGMARNAKSREVRKDAIFWLSRNSDDATLDELMKIFQSETDVEVKKQIVFALKRMGSPGALAKLYEIARGNGEVEVRKDALHWIGQRGGAEAVNYLIQLYDQESNDEIKNQIIFALSRANDKSALRKLIDIAKRDKSIELRKQAVFWLGRSDDPEAAKFLEDLLQ